MLDAEPLVALSLAYNIFQVITFISCGTLATFKNVLIAGSPDTSIDKYIAQLNHTGERLQ